MGGRCLDGQLAGEHHLLDRGRADALDGGGDDPLVALRRIAAEDPSGPARMRVGRRQDRGAQRARAVPDARLIRSSGSIPGSRKIDAVRKAPSGPRAIGDLRQHCQRRRKRGPERVRSAAGRTRSRWPRRPAPAGSSAGSSQPIWVAERSAPQVREAVLPCCHLGGRPDSGEGEAAIRLLQQNQRSVASREPRRSPPGHMVVGTDLGRRPNSRLARSRGSGCSQQNQRSAASLEPAAIATGSTSGSISTVAETRRVGRVRSARARASSRPVSSVSVDSAAIAIRGRLRRPAWRGRSRPRPCAPSRSGRAGGSFARRPRSCRRCR